MNCERRRSALNSLSLSFLTEREKETTKGSENSIPRGLSVCDRFPRAIKTQRREEEREKRQNFTHPSESTESKGSSRCCREHYSCALRGCALPERREDLTMKFAVKRGAKERVTSLRVTDPKYLLKKFCRIFEKRQTFDEHEKRVCFRRRKRRRMTATRRFPLLSSRSTERPCIFRSRFSKQDHYSRTNTT